MQTPPRLQKLSYWTNHNKTTLVSFHFQDLDPGPTTCKPLEDSLSPFPFTLKKSWSWTNRLQHPDPGPTTPKPPQDFLSPFHSYFQFFESVFFFIHLQYEILFVKLSHQNQDQHLTNQDYHLTQKLTISTKTKNKTHNID